ncbi:aldo/keto reductase [Bacteroidia bacterium]|nr:aldo/keto reductase [Bacteroidia bacterium]
MQYRTDLKSGNKLSALGFGCMRFPRNLNQIDISKSEKLILTAIQNGVNYFDTAYVYGGSEDTLGQIIQKNNIREKMYLATKLPFGKCRSYDDFDTLFQTQLQRLHTDYIDYYLIHNLPELKLWENLCKLGIEKWIEKKKEAGQIKQIGFSFHGVHDEFLSLLDAYNWDFCQIQYNYININYQAGMAGLKKASEKGLPVIIMEPLLGGKLANGLPEKAIDLFQSANNTLSPAAWALRWLWNQPEATVVLSGMSEEEQLKENMGTVENAMPGTLTDNENEVIQSVIDIFNKSYKIPCTGCGYCMPCPQKVNIPGCFTAYNVSYVTGMFSGFQQYATSTRAMDLQENYKASRCIKCGRCEKQCPQHIPITKSLEQVRKRMEPFWLQFALKLYLKLRG